MNELLKKLQIKDQSVAKLLNVPDELTSTFSDLEINASSLVSIIFAKNKAELSEQIHELFNAYQSGDLLWICYPKKSSKQYKNSDLNRDLFMKEFTTEGFRAVRLISINDDWSAIRMRQLSEVK